MGYIRYLGHSAFEIRLGETTVYVDPWLGNPASPISVDEVSEGDVVVVTHFHGDHVGDTEAIARRTGATVVAVYEIASYFEERGLRAVGMNIGGPAEINGIRILFTPAAHSSQVGVASGVILVGEEATVYHAGDTGLFAGMELYGKLYPIDYALVPIGGHFTMDPQQAALFVSTFRPRHAIPMHYGTFPVLYGKPEEFEKYVALYAPDTQVITLKPGEIKKF